MLNAELNPNAQVLSCSSLEHPRLLSIRTTSYRTVAPVHHSSFRVHHFLDPVRFFRFDFEAGFELADRFSQLRGQLVRHLFGRFNLVG